ncbi:hypothetical protein [Bradyrhizobium sp.]|uniref:hypothetical protein n=1 Tax=Bradyrhizobium sp. TaxID=376 RepID=UPI001D9F2552|nr:hypothetical protein [Bradyrhizobium sp.]MBI5319882.1 hypothetical protein [Bradyrhizobium sp.]
MFSKSARFLQSALLSTAVALPVSAQAAALITAEEAALPVMKGAVATSNRGITRGPKITVTEDAAAKSPIRFQVKFQPLGGSNIDVDGVKVIYLKQPNVDLTPRVKPFVQPTGIDMPDAQLPPGDHLVRVDVKDSEGRVSTTSFMLKIAP